MTIQTVPYPRFLTQTKCRAEEKLGGVEAFHLQGQFTCPFPLRNERPAAHVLAERLAEADPASTSLIFIS